MNKRNAAAAVAAILIWGALGHSGGGDARAAGAEPTLLRNGAMVGDAGARADASGQANVATKASGPAQVNGSNGTNEKAPEKPAEAMFKNIQVLTGQPASKVREAMEFMAASLGVRCGFCHVNPFPSDVKKTKMTARKMIRMEMDINRMNFNGHTEVTCYTCHQGQEKPVSTPRAGTMGEMFAAAAKIPEIDQTGSLPTTEEVLARFEKAMGGAQTLEGIKTRVSKGVEMEAGEKPNAVVYEMKTTRDVPVAGRIEVALEHGGAYVEGFDGTQAWSEARGKRETRSGFQRMEIVRELELNPAAALRGQYKQARVVGKIKMDERPGGDGTGNTGRGTGGASEKNDSGGAAANAGESGRDAYVVEATAPDGGIERFYFEVKTGLLVRRVTSYQTFLGAMPLEGDYSDYRAVNGAEVAFTTSWWAGGDSWTVKLSEVKNNAPVDAARFEAAASVAGGER
jgi:hypothetical protein